MKPVNNYLLAARGKEPPVTPVWLMRQAGRYLPEYRALRKKHDFLTLCRTPQLAAEVTLQPVRRFGFDAAIIFSDILIPLEPMGVKLTYSPGPRLEKRIESPADAKELRAIDPRSDMRFLMEALSLVKAKLPRSTALLGFAGAPFTLLTYLVEGGHPANIARTKGFLYHHPVTALDLLKRLSDMTVLYLAGQIEAGAGALQLFDSHGGELSAREYEQYSLPFTKRVFGGLSDMNAPKTLFVRGGAHLLGQMAATGCDVASVDWRTELASARRAMKGGAIQGNLDPTALFAPVEAVKEMTRRALDSAGGKAGYIFNLGHGVLPGTPVESVHAVVEEVRK